MKEHNYIIDYFRFLIKEASATKKNKKEKFLVHPLENLEYEVVDAAKKQNSDKLLFYRNIIIDIPNEYNNIQIKNSKQKLSYYQKRWNGLDWHKKLVYKMIKNIINVSDEGLIHLIISIPLEISWMALKRKDISTYNNYIRLVGYPAKMYVDDHFDLLIETTLMWLRETAQYHLNIILKEETIDINDYYLPLFLTFQDLLKYFYENNNLESFKLCYENFTSIFRSIVSREEVFPEINHWVENDDVKNRYSKAFYLQLQILYGGIGAFIYNKNLESEPDSCKKYLEIIF